jgi:hypothetical protein
MNLLTFAHKNEAAAFFHYHQFQECSDFHGLYFNGHHYLLITGEGLWDCLTKCLLTLSYLNQQNIFIQKIINLGVAGGLRSPIKKFSAYQVRTSYAALNFQEPEFHSYSTNIALSTIPHLEVIDCLSFYKRNTTHQEKLKLSPYAHLIDRELWAIAKAAVSCNLPWEAIKVISDEIQDENSCQIVQQDAHLYSKILHDQWQRQIDQKISEPSANSQEEMLNTLQEKSLHLTFSQKHQVTDLITRILAQENLTLNQFLREIPFQEWQLERPKDNTLKFIQWLKIRLTPQLGKYASQISKWLDVWHHSHLNLHLSTSHDLEALEVKFKSYNAQDWEETLQYLKKIPRHELELILSGRS